MKNCEVAYKSAKERKQIFNLMTRNVETWCLEADAEAIKWKPELQKWNTPGKTQHSYLPYPEDATFLQLKSRGFAGATPAIRGLN